MSKTSKTIAKRFKITKSGKVLYRPAAISHFLAKKSSSQKRRNAGLMELKGPLAREVKRRMPYR